MKRLFLFIILLLITSYAVGQSRLKYSDINIKREIPTVKESYTKDNIYILTYNTKKYEVIHFFDPYKYCYCTMIIPNNEKVLTEYIEKYNNSYTKVTGNNRTIWVKYSYNETTSVELIKLDSIRYAFVWLIVE